VIHDCGDPLRCMGEDCACQCHPRNVPRLRHVVLEFDFREGIASAIVRRGQAPELLTSLPDKFKPHVLTAAGAAAEELFRGR
jgi:hypothetical protein